jgi:hypothetical protein
MLTQEKLPELQRGRHGRAQTWIRRLWTALETSEGRRLTNQELSTYLNISDTALSDWVGGKTELNQIEAVLKLCERLSRAGSIDLLRQNLRAFPTLNSQELAHDPATVDRIRKLLLKPFGLTFVLGGSATQRTFLLGAIGNSYRQASPTSSCLAGWDIHAPSWFVPLPGLLYLNSEHTEPGLLREEAVRQHLIMSNGLWGRYASHRRHLMNLASKRHVVVADALTASLLREHTGSERASLHVLEIGGEIHRRDSRRMPEMRSDGIG